MKFKLIMAFLILIGLLGVLSMYLNFYMTSEYPMYSVCKQIRDFNLKYERFPKLDEFNSLNVPDVSWISVREYQIKDDDFLFYICPSILGPCEVCSKNEGPYFEEI